MASQCAAEQRTCSVASELTNFEGGNADPSVRAVCCLGMTLPRQRRVGRITALHAGCSYSKDRHLYIVRDMSVDHLPSVVQRLLFVVLVRPLPFALR